MRADVGEVGVSQPGLHGSNARELPLPQRFFLARSAGDRSDGCFQSDGRSLAAPALGSVRDAV
jgi:hypothetical protein